MRTRGIWDKKYVEFWFLSSFICLVGRFHQMRKIPTFIQKWCFQLNNRTFSIMFMASNFHCSSCIMRITLSYHHHHHHHHHIGILSSHTFSHLVNRLIIKSLIDLCLWHLGFNQYNTIKQSESNNPKKFPHKTVAHRWMMPMVIIIRPPFRSSSPRSRLAGGSFLKAVPHGSLSGGTWTDS